MQSLDLSGAYKDSPEITTFVRRLAVLPLVPPNEIDDVWLHLHGNAPAEVPGISDLCDYMVTTWVDDMASCFHRDMWNHFHNLLSEGVRTNNHLESFHASFRKAFSSAHPNIYVFITNLKKKQAETENEVRMLTLGNAPPPKKRARREKEAKIKRILEQYQRGDRDLWSYMDAMVLTVKLQL